MGSWAIANVQVAGNRLRDRTCYLADGEPGLVRLLGPRDVLSRELWLVLHRDSRRIGRIRAFVEHFTEQIESQADAFRGEGSGAATN